VDRDADLDAPYRARWPDPARALSSDPSLRGAGFGLTSRTCPNPVFVRTETRHAGARDADAVTRVLSNANEPGSPVDVPVVHFARVRGFVDDSDGERTEVWETASARGEVSSAPSPAERLAALSRQVEAMRRDVARNRDALRAMEAHAASERMAGE
jgi:hypothetical protein